MSTLKRRTGKLRRGFAHGIPRVYTFSNGKGGTGKTSLTANVGAIAAEAGYHVLLVDLDPQANLIQDLGLEGQADDGEAFANALHKRQALPVIKDVRPNLDVVPGGSKDPQCRSAHFLQRTLSLQRANPARYLLLLP